MSSHMNSRSNYSASSHGLLATDKDEEKIHLRPAPRATITQSNGHGHGHSTGNDSGSFFLWIILDGIGLSIVAACTILEGMQLWDHFFHNYWASNSESIIYWILGRSCQVFGIVILLVFTATMNQYHILETGGMAFLTLGPIINMYACTLFEVEAANDDDTGGFNLNWIAGEIVELIGIILLDISCFEFDIDIIGLCFEVSGFAFLVAAAMFDYDFSRVDISTAIVYIPTIVFRQDMVDYGETSGLLILTLAAIGLHFVTQEKERREREHRELKQRASETHGTHAV